MLRIFLLMILVLSLFACASPQQNQQVLQFKVWQAYRLTEADVGKIPWSQYYSELWSRMNQLPYDPQKPLILATTAELIPLARKYEAGQITQEQFIDARRIIISRSNQEQQSIQQRQQAINDAQAEQLYRLGNQIMQPRTTTTNCLTTKVGPNTLSTNCN